MPRAEKGTGKHLCPLCNKRFTRPSDVERHIVGMHSRERPFPCARYLHGCSFAASQKCNRKAHYRAYPECAKAAELLERTQSSASVEASKSKLDSSLAPALPAAVTSRKPRTRTRTSAREASAPYSTSDRHGPPPSEASTSESSGAHQTGYEASPSYQHVQLHLDQCQLPPSFYPYRQQQKQQQTFDLDPLSFYQQPQQLETWSYHGLQSTSTRQWDQQQCNSLPACPNEQLFQDSYMKELLSLPSLVDPIPSFDDAALQNILTGTYTTGNISDSLAADSTAQSSPILASYLDFMSSADDLEDWERIVRENPPSPSVLNSLPLIDDHMDHCIGAMASVQGFNTLVY